jgi:hypothetical protein
MYKSVCVMVILLAAFAFMSGSRSADASPTTPISPAIVARGKLLNQTAPIPATTIFTPTQTGLYRLSVYATITRADPSSQSDWLYSFGWTDDSGPVVESDFLYGYPTNVGQFFSYNNSESFGGAALPFEAKAGTPITYSMAQQNGPDNSAYSLYYTLERLE